MKDSITAAVKSQGAIIDKFSLYLKEQYGHLALMLLFVFYVAVLIIHLGVFPTISILFSVTFFAFLPGIYLISKLFTNLERPWKIIFGAVIGLGIAALGGFISGWTQIYSTRYIPSVAIIVVATVTWIRTRKMKVGQLKKLSSKIKVDNAQFLWLAIAISGFTLTSRLLITLKTLNPDWESAYRLFNDIPWQIALVSEVANRAPEFFPYIHNQPLQYTWGLHSFLGVIAGFSNVSPYVMITTFWPVLYAALLPLTIAGVSWVITKNITATIVTALIVPIFAGFQIGSIDSLHFFPTSADSPTYEMGLLFLAVSVGLFILFVRTRSTINHKLFAGILFFFCGISFLNSSIKGSSGVLLMAAVGTYWLLNLIIEKKFPDFRLNLVFSVLVAGFLISSFTVIRQPGGIQFGIFSYVDPLNKTNLISVFTVTLAYVLVSLSSVAIIAIRLGKNRLNEAGAIFGMITAGALLTSVFYVQGNSQLYFLLSTMPLFIILVVFAFSEIDVKLIPIVFLAIFAVEVFKSSFSPLKPAIAVLAICGFILISPFIGWVIGKTKLILPQANFPTRWLFSTGLVLISLTGLTNFSLLGYVGSYPTTASETGAVTPGQYAALEYIKSHSSDDEVVATNRQCLDAQVSPPECDHRYFAITALSDRRVFLNGWGYEGKGKKWIPQNFELNNNFFNKPSELLLKELKQEGVRILYLDKFAPGETDLTKFADLMFDNQDASVYFIK